MTAYLLDTNVCLDFLLDRSVNVVRRLGDCFERCAISTISVAELRVGSRTSSDPAEDERKLDLFLAGLNVMPFDDRAAERYGLMMRDIAMRRTNFDRLIAAHALAVGLVLVTSNIRDFADIPGLQVEDWTR